MGSQLVVHIYFLNRELSFDYLNMNVEQASLKYIVLYWKFNQIWQENSHFLLFLLTTVLIDDGCLRGCLFNKRFRQSMDILANATV